MRLSGERRLKSNIGAATVETSARRREKASESAAATPHECPAKDTHSSIASVPASPCAHRLCLKPQRVLCGDLRRTQVVQKLW